LAMHARNAGRLYRFAAQRLYQLCRAAFGRALLPPPARDQAGSRRGRLSSARGCPRWKQPDRVSRRPDWGASVSVRPTTAALRIALAVVFVIIDWLPGVVGGCDGSAD
jgi:hypothetical protein